MLRLQATLIFDSARPKRPATLAQLFRQRDRARLAPFLRATTVLPKTQVRNAARQFAIHQAVEQDVFAL
jgi:hypothetical protein